MTRGIPIPSIDAPAGSVWHLNPDSTWDLQPWEEPPVRYEIHWGGRWQVAYYDRESAVRFLPNYVEQHTDAHIVEVAS